jgi:predicted GNAT family acetyltransferase
MPTRPGIIIPALLFASWADKGCALVVMGVLCRNKSLRVKTTARYGGTRNVGRVTTSTLESGFILTDEKDASRYTLVRDGQLVSVLDYRDDGRTIALTRAFTIPSFRGHGYAGVVVEGAVADIAAKGDRKVDPVCWYVAEWFAAHPDRRSLLRTR